MSKNSISFSTNIITSSYAFLKTILSNPCSTGMICPSSRFLCNAMAKNIPSPILQEVQTQILHNDSSKPQGYFVELGAGTGAVTKALLKYNIPPSRLLVFERSKNFADYLKTKFPGIRIIQDDAAKMQEYLPHNGYIACIISSLPFVSLPEEVSKNIIYAMKNAIGNGCIIQYTYALNQKTLLEEYGFTIKNKQNIYLNIPPACIYTYTL